MGESSTRSKSTSSRPCGRVEGLGPYLLLHVPRISQYIREVIDSAAGPDRCTVIFDFADSTYIETSVISEIEAAHLRLRAQGSDIMAVSSPERLAGPFGLAALDPTIEMLDSAPESTMSLLSWSGRSPHQAHRLSRLPRSSSAGAARLQRL